MTAADGSPTDRPEGIGEPLSGEQRARGQRAIVSIAASNSVMNACIGVSSYFYLAAGATPFLIGLLTSVTRLAPANSLLGLYLIPRVGKARLGALGRAVALIPLFLLALVALRAKPDIPTVWLTLVLLGLRTYIMAAGDTGWSPLLHDNVERERTGRFFAHMRVRLRFIDFLLPLAVGWYLGKSPSMPRFAPLFALGAAAVMFAMTRFRLVPERLVAPPQSGQRGRFRIALHDSALRRSLWYNMLRTALSTLAIPYWIVFLLAKGLPVNMVVWLSTFSMLGNVTGLRWWGAQIDRHGPRFAIAATTLAEAFLGLGWLLLPAGGPGLVVWVGAFHYLWGIAEGGLSLATTRVNMHAVPVAAQSESFVLMALASAACGLAFGVAGGAAFQWCTAHPALLRLDSRGVYLGTLQLAQLLSWLASRGLPGYREQTSLRALVGGALRGGPRRRGAR